MVSVVFFTSLILKQSTCGALVLASQNSEGDICQSPSAEQIPLSALLLVKGASLSQSKEKLAGQQTYLPESLTIAPATTRKCREECLFWGGAGRSHVTEEQPSPAGRRPVDRHYLFPAPGSRAFAPPWPKPIKKDKRRRETPEAVLFDPAGSNDPDLPELRVSLVADKKGGPGEGHSPAAACYPAAAAPLCYHGQLPHRWAGFVRVGRWRPGEVLSVFLNLHLHRAIAGSHCSRTFGGI